MPTLAEKQTAMSRKSASDEAAGVVIPRFQSSPIPERVSKPFPELAKWHAEESDGREQWRLRTSVTLNRAITDTSKSLQDQINALQATVIDLQNQINALPP